MSDEEEKLKITKLALRSDWPTAVSSREHGHNLNTYGFNVDYIAARNPGLAMEIRELYDQATRLRDEYEPDAR